MFEFRYFGSDSDLDFDFEYYEELEPSIQPSKLNLTCV